MSSATPPATPTPGRRKRSRKEQWTLLAGGFVVALGIVFAILNLNKVKVNWIVTTTQTSLTIVIVVSFALGLGLGALLHRRASR